MNAPTPEFSLIADLEARQDDLLLRLDELNKRVERTLAECQIKQFSPLSGAVVAAGPAAQPLQHC